MREEKIKISTQAYPHNWEQIKNIAQNEGRLTDSIVNEAFELLISKRKQLPRDHVLDAFEDSTNEFDELYKLLAK